MIWELLYEEKIAHVKQLNNCQKFYSEHFQVERKKNLENERQFHLFQRHHLYTSGLENRRNMDRLLLSFGPSRDFGLFFTAISLWFSVGIVTR